MLSLGTILHPTDFSPASQAAFELACALARDHGARLVVLHVGAAPVISPVSGVVPAEPARYQEELSTVLLQVAPKDSRIAVEHVLLLATDPAQEILRVAEQKHCDLIVMGTHGRTGLGRVLMGSVAEQIVRRAPCPVLAMKMPLPEKAPREDAGEPKSTRVSANA